MILKKLATIGACDVMLLFVVLFTLTARTQASELDFADFSNIILERQVAPVTCSGQTNGSIYTAANGANFTIECGFDRFVSSGAGDGALASPNSATVSNYAQCIEYCASLPGCVDVSWSGSCYPKSVVAWVANFNPNVAGARLTNTTYNQTLICPASNGTNFTMASSNNVYTVVCGLDSKTSNLKTVQTLGLDDCITQCDATPGCMYAGWGAATPNGTCYMKSMYTTPVSNSGVWGAYLSSGSNSASGGGSTSSSSTSGATTSAVSSSSGSTNSAGITSSSASTSSITAAPTTSSFTISSSSSTTSKGPVPTMAFNTSADITCPDSNGTLYSTYNSEVFIIECYVDRPGNLASPNAANVSYCMDLCALTTGCVDITFDIGVCYMKSTIGALSANAAENTAVIGARWANQTVAVATVANSNPSHTVTTPVPLASFTGLPYTVIEDMEPSSFFDHFTFNTDPDATGGEVDYINRQTAQKYGMYSSSSSQAVWSVDTTEVLTASSGLYRKSIRLISKNNYTQGMYVLDIAHMPFGCGTWPAFWSIGPNWPSHGEIDIIEGVNQNNYNSLTLHTQGESCLVSGTNISSTSAFGGNTCSYDGGDTVGCSFTDSDPQSYGAGLNAAGGGVYVMEWTSDWIRVWFFNRQSIPASISSGTPDPSTFGTPRANFQFLADTTNVNNSVCTIDQLFGQHQIVFDVTFCGQWAGQTYVYNSSGCPNDNLQNPSQGCVDYVMGNPKDFSQAFWAINSLKVYQRTSATNTSEGIAPSAIMGTDAALTSSVGCPSYSGSTFIYNGLRYRLMCGYDTPGSSATASGQVDSFMTCIKHCDADPQCLTVSYVPSSGSGANTCYVKHFLNAPQGNFPSVWLAQLYDTAISPSANISGYVTYTPPTSTSTTSSSMMTTSMKTTAAATSSSMATSSGSSSPHGVLGGSTTSQSSQAPPTGTTKSTAPGSSSSPSSSSTSSTTTTISMPSKPPLTTITANPTTTITGAPTTVASYTTVISTASTTFSPLPTSTGTPACDTVFLDNNGTTYRIYCNTTISGTPLLTTPLSNFSSCISLCDSYNSTCIASVFTNSSSPSCQLVGNSTSGSGMAKRATAAAGALAYQAQVFVAYHLVNASQYQGPPAPAPPVALGVPGTSSSLSSSATSVVGGAMGGGVSVSGTSSSVSAGATGTGGNAGGQGGSQPAGSSGSGSGTGTAGSGTGSGSSGSGSSGSSGSGSEGSAGSGDSTGAADGMCAANTVVVRVDYTHTHYPEFPLETAMASMSKGPM